MYPKSAEEMAEDARTLAPELLKVGIELAKANAGLSNDVMIHDMLVKAIEMSTSEFHNRELIDWRRARALIEHENNLINHRVTWLILSQAALLGAFATIYNTNFEKGDSIDKGIVAIPLLFIISFGCLICFNIYFQLRAASIQTDRVTDWWYGEALKYDFDKESTKKQIDSLEPNPNEEEVQNLIESLDYKNAIKKKIDVLNSRHPPLHYWKKHEIKLTNSKIGNLFVLRTEALPWYFMLMWVMLLIGGMIKQASPTAWKNIGEFMLKHGILWGAIGILLIISVVAGISIGQIQISRKQKISRKRKAASRKP